MPGGRHAYMPAPKVCTGGAGPTLTRGGERRVPRMAVYVAYAPPRPARPNAETRRNRPGRGTASARRTRRSAARRDRSARRRARGAPRTPGEGGPCARRRAAWLRGSYGVRRAGAGPGDTAAGGLQFHPVDHPPRPGPSPAGAPGPGGRRRGGSGPAGRVARSLTSGSARRSPRGSSRAPRSRDAAGRR